MWDWFQIIIIGLLVLIFIQLELTATGIAKRLDFLIEKHQPQADQQDITREKLREDIRVKLDSIVDSLSDISYDRASRENSSSGNRLLHLIHDEQIGRAHV